MTDYGGVPSVDDEANLESLYGKIDKIGGFWKSGKAGKSLARYIPNILPVTRQNQIAGSIPRKAFASVAYSDVKTLGFIIELTANTCSNFFGHWMTNIDIRRYLYDTKILPTNISFQLLS